MARWTTRLAEKAAGGIPGPARWKRALQTSRHGELSSSLEAQLWCGTCPLGTQNPCFLPASQQHEHVSRIK